MAAAVGSWVFFWKETGEDCERGKRRRERIGMRQGGREDRVGV